MQFTTTLIISVTFLATALVAQDSRPKATAEPRELPVPSLCKGEPSIDDRLKRWQDEESKLRVELHDPVAASAVACRRAYYDFAAHQATPRGTVEVAKLIAEFAKIRAAWQIANTTGEDVRFITAVHGGFLCDAATQEPKEIRAQLQATADGIRHWITHGDQVPGPSGERCGPLSEPSKERAMALLTKTEGIVASLDAGDQATALSTCDAIWQEAVAIPALESRPVPDSSGPSTEIAKDLLSFTSYPCTGECLNELANREAELMTAGRPVEALRMAMRFAILRQWSSLQAEREMRERVAAELRAEIRRQRDGGIQEVGDLEERLLAAEQGAKDCATVERSVLANGGVLRAAFATGMTLAALAEGAAVEAKEIGAIVSHVSEGRPIDRSTGSDLAAMTGRIRRIAEMAGKGDLNATLQARDEFLCWVLDVRSLAPYRVGTSPRR